MGITNHEKRVVSTFLRLHLHKPSEHKTTKTKPHVLHVLPFMRGGEGGREGQRGHQYLFRHQLHGMLLLRRKLDR